MPPNIRSLPSRSLSSHICESLTRRPSPTLARCYSTSPRSSLQNANFQAQCSRQTYDQHTLSRNKPTRTFQQQRTFTETRARRAPKTVQQVKARNRSGPFNWKAGVLFFGTGAGLIVYFRYEKDRMQRQRIAEQNKGMGKPLVGGKFELVDTQGRPFTEKDLKGKYSLIYFGFTHCPDICPDELDKMARMIDLVKERSGNILKPVFISCDPWRDSPEVVHKYLQEFHPEIIGLTGEYDNVKATCKAYRVYFSTPPQLKPGEDYLVDHSIYFYLMDPDGDFVEAIGRERTAQQGADAICDFAKDWRGKINES